MDGSERDEVLQEVRTGVEELIKRKTPGTTDQATLKQEIVAELTQGKHPPGCCGEDTCADCAQHDADVIDGAMERIEGDLVPKIREGVFQELNNIAKVMGVEAQLSDVAYAREEWEKKGKPDEVEEKEMEPTVNLGPAGDLTLVKD